MTQPILPLSRLERGPGGEVMTQSPPNQNFIRHQLFVNVLATGKLERLRPLAQQWGVIIPRGQFGGVNYIQLIIELAQYIEDRAEAPNGNANPPPNALGGMRGVS